jgi:hypothetical protein
LHKQKQKKEQKKQNWYLHAHYQILNGTSTSITIPKGVPNVMTLAIFISLGY